MTICTLSDALISLTVGSNKLANSEIFHNKKINNSGKYLCIIYRPVEEKGGLKLEQMKKGLAELFGEVLYKKKRSASVERSYFRSGFFEFSIQFPDDWVFKWDELIQVDEQDFITKFQAIFA